MKKEKKKHEEPNTHFVNILENILITNLLISFFIVCTFRSQL